jgi:hypothetical protein
MKLTKIKFQNFNKQYQKWNGYYDNKPVILPKELTPTDLSLFSEYDVETKQYSNRYEVTSINIHVPKIKIDYELNPVINIGFCLVYIDRVKKYQYEYFRDKGKYDNIISAFKIYLNSFCKMDKEVSDKYINTLEKICKAINSQFKNL